MRAQSYYVFILHRGVDPLVDSRFLSEHYGLLRPTRQHCGLLAGTSLINRNHFARYVSLRIRIAATVADIGTEPRYLLTKIGFWPGCSIFSYDEA